MLRFRPLARGDFPLLAHWLRQPHVARWWADDSTPAGLEADYGGCIDGTEPAEVFIVERDGAAIGLLQRFRIDSYPEYAAELATALRLPPGAWSIDYLVGETAETGRGLGARMIEAFTAQLWRDAPQASCVIVPIHSENVASGRVLEKAGYVRTGECELTPDNPADSRRHVVYRRDRISLRP